MQGTGQGRILAPFMYKVYTNGSLIQLDNDSFTIATNGLTVSYSSFADDILLLNLYPSSLQISMDSCYDYSYKWKFEFNHTNSGGVTFLKIIEPTN